MSQQVGFIGFGEAAQAITAGWTQNAVDVGDVLHFDILAKRSNVPSLRDLAQQCDTILSTVTAASAEQVAQELAAAPGTVTQFLDLNSISPEGKRRNAVELASAGIEYVDVAVMAPIHPRLHQTPMLVSASQCQAVCSRLEARFGFKAKPAGDDIGRASTIKMLRSIMVKGMEALTDELVQGAEVAGVLDDVLASLDASRTARTWTQQAAYNIERMETHGKRRGDEMVEVVKTLEELGVDALMTKSTVQRQYNRAKK